MMGATRQIGRQAFAHGAARSHDCGTTGAAGALDHSWRPWKTNFALLRRAQAAGDHRLDVGRGMDQGQLAIAHRIGQGQTQLRQLLAQALAQPLVLAHGKPMPRWELLNVGAGVINVHGPRLSRFEADLEQPL